MTSAQGNSEICEIHSRYRTKMEGIPIPSVMYETAVFCLRPEAQGNPYLQVQDTVGNWLVM